MKFSQMKYTRPNIDELKKKYESLIADFENAKTVDDAERIYLDADEYFEDAGTMAALCAIRHSLDTEDEFYDAENDFLDENLPLLMPLGQKFQEAILQSSHRTALEEKFGKLFFDDIEQSMRTFKPEIIAEIQLENKLTTEYDKLIASAQIEFDGKTLTLAQLAPYAQDKNRETRRAATLAKADWFDSKKTELDRLFHELVKVRHEMAIKLGYKNYIGLGYDKMQRNCYDEKMVKVFRNEIKKHIVPVALALKTEQAKRIGVDRLTVYDDTFLFPDGNAKPKGTPAEIFEAGRKMYCELSPATAEFIDFMLENELFDTETRKGKSGGGYCAYLPKYKSPFIFANFNGTSDDIYVLTHEAGHAFAGYVSRDIKPSDFRNYTYETAEVHSMSMEFFTTPWMELFFQDETEKYNFAHLSDALTFLPYGAMVDEFQHIVYENPDLTPDERNNAWQELEKTYRPHLDNDFKFYAEGRRWQAQSHIYERPFYYIDYCLAQTVALCFFSESKKNYDKAFAKYQKFVGFAGKKTFVDTIKSSNLPDPFVEDSLRELAELAPVAL